MHRVIATKEKALVAAIHGSSDGSGRVARHRSPTLLLAAASLATAGLGLALWAEIPIVQSLWGWFWPLHPNALPAAAALGIAALSLFAFAGAAWVVTNTSSSRTRGRALFLLIGLGFAYHHGLALATGRGLGEMRDRMLQTGHAEFAVTACRGPDAFTLLGTYEELVRGSDQKFARSKPPGHLLIYYAAAALADRVMPFVHDPPPESVPGIVNRCHLRLVNLATVAFPLVALLVLLPLTWLSRFFLAPEHTLRPALIYMTMPAPALVQLHLDQVLYPTLAASFCALVAKAASKPNGLGWWTLAGVSMWVASFVSFSLLPVLPLGIGISVALTAGLTPERRWRRLSVGASVLAGAMLCSGAVAYWTIHYDPWAAYVRAMSNHVAWKGWEDWMRWPAAFLNTVELAYWLGPVPVVLFASEALRSGSGSARTATGMLGAWTLAMIGLTAVLGRTIGEVARLWLFFTPSIVLVVAATLTGLPGAPARRALTALASIQVLWTVSLKAMQDFR